MLAQQNALLAQQATAIGANHSYYAPNLPATPQTLFGAIQLALPPHQGQTM